MLGDGLEPGIVDPLAVGCRDATLGVAHDVIDGHLVPRAVRSCFRLPVL